MQYLSNRGGARGGRVWSSDASAAVSYGPRNIGHMARRNRGSGRHLAGRSASAARLPGPLRFGPLIPVQLRCRRPQRHLPSQQLNVSSGDSWFASIDRMVAEFGSAEPPDSGRLSHSTPTPNAETLFHRVYGGRAPYRSLSSRTRYYTTLMTGSAVSSRIHMRL